MKYISTRGRVEPIEFQDAVMMGLADDGGLLIPQSIPDARGSLDAWRRLAYSELAFEVLRDYATDIPPAELKGLIDKSYGDAFEGSVAPTVAVGDIFVLELWHGPTMSFKDVALQFLGNLFEYTLQRGVPGRSDFMNILAATSGDTGSAAIAGVRSRRAVRIFVMHPHGRISPIQERQMTTVLDKNVHNIAIEGSFDDCQRIMKTLAGDLDFKRRYLLGAVNSVNWARVLAQMVYYFAGVFEVQRQTGAEAVRVCVPTGNFGDILAGWYAMQMGAPISQLILATNENDILARFFNTGVYSLGPVHHTLSPAMDIQVASNFERYLFYKLGREPVRLSKLMAEFLKSGSLTIEPGDRGGVDPAFFAGVGGQSQCLAAIRKYHQQHGYLLDPHTAVGVTVAESKGLQDGPVICLATAHPAKFPDAIKQATGRDLAHHPKIDSLAELPTRCEVLPNDTQAVRNFIIEKVG
ncbi:MAG: threonine synthase [Planctomycetota bacterium]|jgi:threonine synthase